MRLGKAGGRRHRRCVLQSPGGRLPRRLWEAGHKGNEDPSCGDPRPISLPGPHLLGTSTPARPTSSFAPTAAAYALPNRTTTCNGDHLRGNSPCRRIIVPATPRMRWCGSLAWSLGARRTRLSWAVCGWPGLPDPARGPRTRTVDGGRQDLGPSPGKRVAKTKRSQHATQSVPVAGYRPGLPGARSVFADAATTPDAMQPVHRPCRAMSGRRPTTASARPCRPRLRTRAGPSVRDMSRMFTIEHWKVDVQEKGERAAV